MSTVTLSGTTAEAIGHALDQDVYPVENASRMAWLVLLLKKCEDRPEWFPRGKWATIQHIEQQIDNAVDGWFDEQNRSPADTEVKHGTD